MNAERLDELLNNIDSAKIALIGDFCLDVYWRADMRLSELSRETPHYPLPIVSETYSPGGAGNVANNIHALRPGLFIPISIIGKDWRGDKLTEIFETSGIDTDHIIHADGFVTNTYIKPLRRGISDVTYEDPRIDFENRKPLDKKYTDKLLEMLDDVIEKVDVICVSDQMKYGCITDDVRARLDRAATEGKTVIVDSRDNITKYHHCIVKPNEIEASRAYGDGTPIEGDALLPLVKSIGEKNGTCAIITHGSKGCFVFDGNDAKHVPAKNVTGEIDFVGAGDTFLSAFGTFYASGAGAFEAAEMANTASAVTIKKIGTTGTATREEIKARALCD